MCAALSINIRATVRCSRSLIVRDRYIILWPTSLKRDNFLSSKNTTNPGLRDCANLRDLARLRDELCIWIYLLCSKSYICYLFLSYRRLYICFSVSRHWKTQAKHTIVASWKHLDRSDNDHPHVSTTSHLARSRLKGAGWIMLLSMKQLFIRDKLLLHLKWSCAYTSILYWPYTYFKILPGRT